MFEIWFNTERNPLVRHHPPNHLFTIELWGCILQAGMCSSLRCPETSMQPVKPTGTWWDWRDSRDGGTGKGLKGTVSDEQAKFSKSSQAECTSRSGRTTQLAQEHSSSSTPAIMFVMDRTTETSPTLPNARSCQPLPCRRRNHITQADPFLRAGGS